MLGGILDTRRRMPSQGITHKEMVHMDPYATHHPHCSRPIDSQNLSNLCSRAYQSELDAAWYVPVKGIYACGLEYLIW